MFKLPNKFYINAEGGGSSGATTSNKKYEITITQPPEHEPRPDFIRGIPYAAKDNAMIGTVRAMTLDDYKEIKPESAEAPKDVYILQDINGKDLIITSDMIEDMAQMDLHIFSSEGKIAMKTIASVEIYVPKQYFNGKTIAQLSYKMPTGITIVVKISDVNDWYFG